LQHIDNTHYARYWQGICSQNIWGPFGATTRGVCEADFEPDGDVDGGDLALFAADFGRTDCCGCEADFDEDCDVDGCDFALFAADFGSTDCPTQ
jgi:hypothetical protein